MKKFLTPVLIAFLVFGTMFVAGCGGGGQQVNGVGTDDASGEASDASGEEKATTYEVQEGDTLWSIAENAEVYGEKNQWPLIYDANRDILNGYNGTKAGQKLIIPRNVSAEDIEAAKERAAELGYPPKDRSGDENVAGMDDRPATNAGMVNAGGAAVVEQMTPVPEPGKDAKKGGVNIIAIIVILLLAGAGVGAFIYFQKNKKEDEEDTKDDNNTNA